MNDFEILAIQNDLSDLASALNNMQGVRDLVFIENCVSKLILGKKEVPVEFDKMLCSCDKNILLLIIKDSQLSTSDIEEAMYKKNILFSKYVCDKQDDTYKNDEKLQAFSFAGEKDVLKNAIIDSKDKGNNSCIYYPNVLGKLELGYLTDEGRYGLFLRMKVQGVIEFTDKMILLLEKQKSNLNGREIFDVLIDAPVKILVDTNTDVQMLKKTNKNKIFLK